MSVTLPELLRLLACPDCGNTLEHHEAMLRCAACRRNFPLADGRLPILVGKDSEFRGDVDRLASWTPDRAGQNALKLRRKYHFPKTTPYCLTAPAVDLALTSACHPVVLNLGAGRGDRASASGINIDIRPHASCHVVADAHWLPFADESCGTVLSNNMFEYLADPARVVSELRRVLVPGGTVFVQTAFLLPYGRGDRFRFSADGLKQLFRGWETLDAGSSTGPFMALARVAEMAVESILPGRFLPFAGRWLTAWALHPWKFLDPGILRRDKSGAMGSSCFIVARKPADDPTPSEAAGSGRPADKTPR